MNLEARKIYTQGVAMEEWIGEGTMNIPNPMDRVYELTRDDWDFIASFGSIKKPVTLKEFIKFWDSLTVNEQLQIRADYFGW